MLNVEITSHPDDPAKFSLQFDGGVKIILDVNTSFITLNPIIRALNLAHVDKQVADVAKKWIKSPNAMIVAAKLLKDDCGIHYYEVEDDENPKEIFIHPAILLAYDNLGPVSRDKLTFIAMYSYTFSQMMLSFASCDKIFFEERIRSLNKRILELNKKSVQNEFKGSCNDNMRAIVSVMREDTIDKLKLTCKIEIAVMRWLYDDEDMAHLRGNNEDASVDDDVEEPDEERVKFEIGEMESTSFCGSLYKLKCGSGFLFILPSGDRFYTPNALKPVRNVLKYLSFGFCGFDTSQILTHFKHFFPDKKTVPSVLTLPQIKQIQTQVIAIKVSDMGWLASIVSSS